MPVFLPLQGLNKNNYTVQIISKIENQAGIDNIEEIINVSNGIMIARGDMGVSIPIFKVPIVQKSIISRCNFSKKTVITATQMLENMTEHIRPIFLYKDVKIYRYFRNSVVNREDGK